ncbi:MAG: CPBP family intramembrane glutamic endopeptidase [Candidatus Omnitrophota bacterium]
MNCPHCDRELPDTAVRCRYCRRRVRPDVPCAREGRAMAGAESFIKNTRALFVAGRHPGACPWSFTDVLAITILIFVFLLKDPFNLGSNILRFLRLHFFIFTKEPKLLYYLTVYLSSILLKCVCLIYLKVLIVSRRISFSGTVLARGDTKGIWRVWMPLYLCVCLILNAMGRANPLVPDIPFNSVFPEALFVGNAVIIFSVLVIAPFAEEILFRGFLFPALNKYAGTFPSVVITSALFTLAHYPMIKEDYTYMLTIFFLGILITYAKAKTGSTWIAIVMHFFYNFISVGMGFIDYIIFGY